MDFIIYSIRETKEKDNKFLMITINKNAGGKEKMEEKILQEELKKAYKTGLADGIKIMKQRILLAAEKGTPIEVQGRVYFIKTDLENLRDIMDDMEAAWNE